MVFGASDQIDVNLGLCYCNKHYFVASRGFIYKQCALGIPLLLESPRFVGI